MSEGRKPEIAASTYLIFFTKIIDLLKVYVIIFASCNVGVKI